MTKILLKENYYKSVETNFYYAMKKLQESFSKDSLEEVGLEANTEVLIDLLQGGDSTTKQVKETLTSQLLAGKQLPVIRRSNEDIFKQLFQNFENLKYSVYKSMSDFRFIPAKYFFIEADGRIRINTMGERLIKEKSNLYIDKAEQIETYNAVNEVLKAIGRLNNITQKYKCTAIGREGVLTIINGELTINYGVISECHPGGAWATAR